MDRVPDYVLFEIFCFLDNRELMRGPAQASKLFYSIIKGSDFLLNRVIRNHFVLDPSYVLNYSVYQNICMQFYSTPKIKLSFKGFATTGGSDSDLERYWVDNLYKDNGDYYCTRENKLNINTAGVLENALLEDENCEFILRILKNKEKFPKFPRFEYNGEDRILRSTKENFVHWYKRCKADVIRIVAEQFNEKPEDVEQKLAKDVSNIDVRELSVSTFRRRPDDNMVLQDNTDVNRANLSTDKAIIVDLEISIQGYLTCPLQTFIVFCSDCYIDVEDEEFARYDDILTYEQLVSCFPEECSSLKSSEFTQYCLFKPSSRKLKPITWGKFTSRNNDTIQMPLENPIICTYLYAKLINPDNRMAQFNDAHPFPNIDVNFIKAKGFLVSLKNSYL